MRLAASTGMTRPEFVNSTKRKAIRVEVFVVIKKINPRLIFVVDANPEVAVNSILEAAARGIEAPG